MLLVSETIRTRDATAALADEIMLITAGNICQYLIAKGIISSESVVDGDFAVVDVSGRNRNFKVLRGRRSGYFLKQIQNWDVQTIAMLQCEAACYWLARNEGEFSRLASVMPEFHWYDAERHILITGLIAQSENLYEHSRRIGKFPADVASILGSVLGSYHSVAANGLKDSPHTAIFPRQIPWILCEDRRNSHPFKELSRATSELFDTVERSSELGQAFDELRTDWRADALIHGDLRLENCILFKTREGGELSIKLVDWELADIGDACWDIGGIIQAYLSASIVRLSIDALRQPAQIRTAANEAKPAIRSLWKDYINARRVEVRESKQLLERCLKHAAVRMIQSAYEHVQFSPQVSPAGSYLVEASAKILQNPRQAAADLLDQEST